MSAKSGSRAIPLSVSEYSVCTGLVGSIILLIIPKSSSSRNLIKYLLEEEQKDTAEICYSKTI